ncbi:hypothetical protein [Dyella sp.]|uniref:hypothetical protein n=1 Tax=Dyella sp. TaxID=1869338 RepID=UPI002FDB6F6A
MSKEEKAIGITAELYRIRKAMQFLWGEQYPAKMAEWRTTIEQVAKAKQISHLEAAMQLGEEAQKRGSEHLFLLIMSAYVEMTEPSAPMEDEASD